MVSRKKRARKKRPVEYIEQLRVKALIALKHFDDSRIFKANKNRDNYEPIHEMLKELVDYEVSTSALVEFFTKSANWDEEEQREVFNYEIYTVEAIEELINLYENDINITTPALGQVTDSLLQNVGNIFNDLFIRNKTVASITERLVIEDNGTCTIHAEVLLKLHSDVSNVKVHYICNHPIKIKWIEAFDHISHERLQIFPYQITECSYVGFILMPRVIDKNTNYHYRYSACIENYYKNDLIDNGIAFEEINIIANKYDYMKEEFSFPDNDTFKDLRVTIKSHPNKELVDKVIIPKLTEGYKLYVVEHGDVGKVNIPIRIELKLKG